MYFFRNKVEISLCHHTKRKELNKEAEKAELGSNQNKNLTCLRFRRGLWVT